MSHLQLFLELPTRGNCSREIVQGTKADDYGPGVPESFHFSGEYKDQGFRWALVYNVYCMGPPILYSFESV